MPLSLLVPRAKGPSTALRPLSPLRGTGGSRARSGSGPDREPPPQARSAAPRPAPLMAPQAHHFRRQASLAVPTAQAQSARLSAPAPQGTLGTVVLGRREGARLEGGGAAPPCGGEERQRALRMRTQRPLAGAQRRGRHLGSRRAALRRCSSFLR